MLWFGQSSAFALKPGSVIRSGFASIASSSDTISSCCTLEPHFSSFNTNYCLVCACLGDLPNFGILKALTTNYQECGKGIGPMTRQQPAYIM
jgi:hypothetical protein